MYFKENARGYNSSYEQLLNLALKDETMLITLLNERRGGESLEVLPSIVTESKVSMPQGLRNFISVLALNTNLNLDELSPSMISYLNTTQSINDRLSPFGLRLLQEYSIRPRFPIRLAGLLFKIPLQELPENIKNNLNCSSVTETLSQIIDKKFFICAGSESIFEEERKLHRLKLLYGSMHFKTYNKSVGHCKKNFVSEPTGEVFIKDVLYYRLSSDTSVWMPVRSYDENNLSISPVAYYPKFEL